MIFDEFPITIRGNKYKYIFTDLLGLLKFVNKAPELTESLEEMLTKHRKTQFTITDFVIEALENVASKFRFSLIYQDKTVVSIARVKIMPQKSIISSVHTSEDFRGKGLCTENLRQLMKRCQTKIFSLAVKTDNILAIKCYEKVGFRKAGNRQFEGKQYFILTRG